MCMDGREEWGEAGSHRKTCTCSCCYTHKGRVAQSVLVYLDFVIILDYC